MNKSQKKSTYKCDECHDTGFIIEKYEKLLGSRNIPCWRNCILPKCRWCSNYGWYWVNRPVAGGREIIQKKRTCYYCEIYKIKINGALGALQIKVHDVD